jgi:hypothetical protein
VIHPDEDMTERELAEKAAEIRTFKTAEERGGYIDGYEAALIAVRAWAEKALRDEDDKMDS